MLQFAHYIHTRPRVLPCISDNLTIRFSSAIICVVFKKLLHEADGITQSGV